MLYWDNQNNIVKKGRDWSCYREKRNNSQMKMTESNRRELKLEFITITFNLKGLDLKAEVKSR